jgi:Uma2 family endonuclease
MAAHEPASTQDAALLEEDFLALDTPEGFKAELIEGNVVVTPPPHGDHEDMIDIVVWQVYERSRTPMQNSATKGLLLPPTAGQTRNRVIPDATFAPRAMRLFRGSPSWMEPAGISMIVEVTSIRAERDRVAKRRCYAAAAIPLYLLIDREHATVTLHSDPDAAKGDYTGRNTVDFGKPLPLPEPFGFDLETADLA